VSEARSLLDLAENLFRSPELSPEPGDYAELLDEEDERGVVVVRRENGEPIAFMARSVWDELRGERP
jgi:hypothetical protein